MGYGLVLGVTLSIWIGYGLNIPRWRDRSDFGWRTMYNSGPNLVAQVFGAGAAAGLRAGDYIVAVNGRRYSTFDELFFGDIRHEAPGSLNTYTVLRDGRPREITIPTGRVGLRDVLWRSAPLYVLGFVFISIGALVFLMKPMARESWLFFRLSCLLGISVSLASPADLIRPTWLYDVRLLSHVLIPASMIHLALVFPKTRAVTVTWPSIVVLPYIPSLVIIGLRHLTSTAYWNMPKSVLLSWLGYTVIGVVFFLISTGWNSLRDPSIVTRLQSRVMVIGILLGFLIPSFDLLSGLLWRVSLFPDPIVGFGVCFSLFPLSIAYTIVKHDLFAIDVIVRRTYGYVLSTGTVVAAYAAVVSLLNITVRGSDVARSPLFSIAFALGVVFMFEPLHRRIQRLVDRTFYRQQYDYRTTIRGLSEAMTSILDPVVIRKTLVDAVVREMFLENGVLLLRRDGAQVYTVESATDVTAESIAAVPSDDALVDLVRERKTHVLRHDVELNPSLQQRRADVLRTFDALASELVLPVTYKEEVRGLLSLGRKKSGKLFTPEDLDLLRTVVNQSAIALENARLFTENLAKGRMEEELKIAHDIQMGMLPDAPPRLKGLQLAARTIPAREVGGDFYDFVSLPPDGGERLGVVIGDVSGKGVSAGLLMAGARSTYRVLVDASASAQEVMILANRRLQRDVRRGMFVALLYAVFERDGRAVTVVNAGQTQPILVQRGAPPEFVVSEGDTFPLGIVADCDYRESTMKLTDGSLVVFYTDGIVEAMNTTGELYGFDRFIESVAEGRELSAPALLDKLVADVVRFTGPAEQHDDITMIVARVE